MSTFRRLSFAAVLAVLAANAWAQAPAHIVVNNAPAAVNIDIFLDAGKVHTVPIGQQGTAGFDLDFLSLGKPQGQLYIETCKDGQRIRIISDGTTVPTDEGCNRKPVGVLFTFTCTKKITLNFAAARASFAGCGTFLTRREVYIPVLVAVGGTLVSTAGGGDDTSTPSVSVQQQPVANAPAAPVAPSIPAPTAPAPSPTPTTPAVGNPGGRQIIATCTVGSDPGSHNAVLQFCSQLRELAVSASNGGMTITGTVIWVTVGGSYNTTTGAFSLSTTGPLAGTSFTAVAFSFVGAIDANGNMQGTVTIGGAGLPGGQAITYTITTRKG